MAAARTDGLSANAKRPDLAGALLNSVTTAWHKEGEHSSR